MALKRRRQKRAKGHQQGQARVGKRSRRTTTIDILPDEILLEIFGSYIISFADYQRWNMKWVKLVHVCRRWRQIIFASPCRLRLELGYTQTLRTPVRKYLRVWPAFPIFMSYDLDRDKSDDNLMAALEHPDRVCGLCLTLTASQLAKLDAIIRQLQQPFPVLKELRLRLHGWNRLASEPVLPRGFLGGSAPSLQELDLSCIPFPSLPMLLSSACKLVTLHLEEITQTSYISPETMVVCLIGLPKLETFSIEFNHQVSRLNQSHISPISRTILPALTSFEFVGFSDYLEDLVAPIDCPQLNYISISYFHHLNWQVSQLFNFINRSEGPRLTLCRWAAVCVGSGPGFNLDLCHGCDYDPTVHISTSWGGWRVSHLIWLLGQFSSKLSYVRHLTILWSVSQYLDHAQWLQLLRPFANVQTLYGYGERVREVALALEDATKRGMAAELFPALALLCWGFQNMPVILVPNFEAARRLSGHPINIVKDPRKFGDVVQSYY